MVSTNTDSSALNSQSAFLLTECHLLIGELVSIASKARDNVESFTKDVHYHGHASDSRVWGNTLKEAYNFQRKRGLLVKELIVKAYGIPIETYLSVFDPLNSEEYGQAISHIESMVKALTELAMTVDNTPIIKMPVYS